MMNKWLFSAVCILLLAVVADNFYVFYFQRDYEFTLEAFCDQAQQSCFHRDCSLEECPPNGLEDYRIFNIHASDFNKCSEDSCLNECLSGSIMCTEVKCGDSEEDICSSDL